MTARRVRRFLLFEAATFVVAALVHRGVAVAGYEHREASIAESVIALVLIAGCAVSWIRPALTRTSAVIAQEFALFGTLIGVVMIVIGVGPQTLPDIAYHVGIVAVLIWGLIVALHAPAHAHPNRAARAASIAGTIDTRLRRRKDMPVEIRRTTMKSTGALKVSQTADREIVMMRVFDAPRRLVFEAWTDPAHLPRWMLGPEDWTMPVCEVDLRPGGAWHFVWRRSDGTRMEMRGVYKEIAPPERLVSTESWGGDWPETLNTLTLSEQDGKTTVALAILYPSKEARDAAFGTEMTEGATASFDRLAALLESLVARGTERRAG